MGAVSGYGKNNFDKLAAAGLVAGSGDEIGEQVSKLETRVAELKALALKFDTVLSKMMEVRSASRMRQIKRVTTLINKVKELHAGALPVGSKKHVATMANELVSVREGLQACSIAADTDMLTLAATEEARALVIAMAAAAAARKEKLQADSSSTSDMEHFFKNAADVISKHSTKAADLADIANKPFLIARAPIIPADDRMRAETLLRVGFNAESLGGYPVFCDQLVIGLNPRHVLGDHSGEVKGLLAGKVLREEADRLRKLLQKKMNQKLNFVSDKSYSPKAGAMGTWFWLMTDTDIDRLIKVSPGNRITITRWGFAFN